MEKSGFGVKVKVEGATWEALGMKGFLERGLLSISLIMEELTWGKENTEEK